jgi:hypothetical protein
MRDVTESEGKGEQALGLTHRDHGFKAHFTGCYLPWQITVAVQNSVTSFDPAHFLSSIIYYKSQKY